MRLITKIVFLLFISIILLSFSVQNKKYESYSLTITVKNLRNSEGVVQFSLYNKEGSIPVEKYRNYYKKDITAIKNNTATIVFNNLLEGKYAINVLHDENKNGKIDKKFILPKEGIGFSNYESIGLTNRPKFSKASFELNTNLTKVVKIIYM